MKREKLMKAINTLSKYCGQQYTGDDAICYGCLLYDGEQENCVLANFVPSDIGMDDECVYYKKPVRRT